MSLAIDGEALSAQSRLVLVSLTNLTMRLMETWWNLAAGLTAEEPDYETIMILGAVFSINSEKFLRSGLPQRLQTLNNPLPYRLLTDSNIRSVAAATGLNRETTRRRVHELLARGVLIKEGKALRLAPGIMQDKRVKRAVQAQSDALRQTTSYLQSIGVLK